MDRRWNVRCGAFVIHRRRVGANIPADIRPAADDTIGAVEQERSADRHDAQLIAADNITEPRGRQR